MERCRSVGALVPPAAWFPLAEVSEIHRFYTLVICNTWAVCGHQVDFSAVRLWEQLPVNNGYS